MVIYNGKDSVGKVAITFDDGPNPEYTPKILDVLKAKKVKATFFLIGKNAEKYPDVVRRIVSEGHDIGNHTYTHRNLSNFLENSGGAVNLQAAKQSIIEEIKKGAEAIKKVSGVSEGDVRYLRPPYLGWNNECGEIAAELYGNRIIMTRTGSEDWNWEWLNWTDENIIKAKTDSIAHDVRNNFKSGTIIALHDGSEKGLPEHGQQSGWEKRAVPTFKALPKIIDSVLSRGIYVVKLSEMDLIEEPLRTS